MSILDSPSVELTTIIEDPFFDGAQMAAAAFLARYSGRTLDAYRYDLRTFFQWASDANLDVPDAKRPHIELYRTSMEQRNLAPSTIDRRLSTVCGFYRLPTSTVELVPILPSTSVGPRSTSPRAEAWTAESLGRSSTPPSGLIMIMQLSPPYSGSMACG